MALQRLVRDAEVGGALGGVAAASVLARHPSAVRDAELCAVRDTFGANTGGRVLAALLTSVSCTKHCASHGLVDAVRMLAAGTAPVFHT